MNAQIKQQIELFNNYLKELSNRSEVSVTELAAHAYLIKPRQSIPLPSHKPIALTLMAVTHGNEVGGIGVLNRLCELLSADLITLPFPVVLALGNVAASLENRRFLQRDMNRSFGRPSQETIEDQRARVLEPFLEQTAYFVDYHQTIEASSSGFLIFPYTEASYQFGRWIAPDLPIVTHWGQSFSKDGACSDEFVNGKQGVGLTIELGQKGFSNYQESLGLNVALRTLAVVKELLSGRQPSFVTLKEPEIYTWAEVLPFPNGDAKLDEGWYNFRKVEKGQRMGEVNGEDLLAPIGGPILFPKYIHHPEQARPKEICRIMKRVSANELGKSI